MRYIPKALFVSTLMFGAANLVLPRTSYAAACSNAHLSGTYSVRIGNASVLTVLNALNTATGDSAAAAPTGGFGDNPSSLGGSTPGLGRYFLTGTGTIIGQGTYGNGAVANTTVGTYSVSYDCTATIKLNSGPSYNAVVVDGGNRVLFIETDSAGTGILGTMERAANSCPALVGMSQSYGFSSSGVQATTASSSAGARYGIYSTVGTVTLNPDGAFVVAGWVASASSVQTVKAGGRYTIGSDCSVKLTFSGTPPSGTPTSLRGFLVGHGQGVFSIQAGNTASVTGQLISQ